jgi:hypothetical protein
VKGLKSRLNGYCGVGKRERGAGVFSNQAAFDDASQALLCPRLALLIEIAPVEQVGADEGIDVAVEDFLYVASFDLGAVVFN